ncbi:DUF4231 domain-containing protein [Paenibacillus sp. FSL L8-0340]|uniref:DUF4231 domain-containing protein n=1 Tax=Paenibacillus sp. FSL L8-0340 TaxID=2954685 RepID=UPI0031586D66
MKISEDQYLKERLEDQIDWYDTKSIECQKTYKWMKRVELVSAALIPILSTQSSGWVSFAVIVSILGAIIVIIEGLVSLGKYHENWIEYRSICETLRQEKYMYLTLTGVYKTNPDEAFDLLVERIESVISKENVNWANLHSAKKGEEST